MRPIKIGDKIKMACEKQRYTIQALNERFIIMTKPFNAAKTYLYTITDLERGVRGPCNLIFGIPFPVNSLESASEALSLLNDGTMEVSYRRCVDLLPSELAQLTISKDKEYLERMGGAV